MSIDKEVAANFSEEVEEMLNNIGEVKGTPYVNAVCAVLNVVNMNNMIATTFSGMVSEELESNIENICRWIISDLIIRVVTLYSPEATTEGHHELCFELSKDVRMLVDKQSEYTKRESI